MRDFPGSLVVKNSPSGAGSVGPISGWGAKIPHASQPKNQSINDRRSIVTNSIKDFKIKKKIWCKLYRNNSEPFIFTFMPNVSQTRIYFYAFWSVQKAGGQNSNKVVPRASGVGATGTAESVRNITSRKWGYSEVCTLSADSLFSVECLRGKVYRQLGNHQWKIWAAILWWMNHAITQWIIFCSLNSN